MAFFGFGYSSPYISFTFSAVDVARYGVLNSITGVSN